MKDEERDWRSIRGMWKDKTGQDTAPSTLPNRYKRLKDNMVRSKEGEVCLYCPVGIPAC